MNTPFMVPSRKRLILPVPLITEQEMLGLLQTDPILETGIRITPCTGGRGVCMTEEVMSINRRADGKVGDCSCRAYYTRFLYENGFGAAKNNQVSRNKYWIRPWNC